MKQIVAIVKPFRAQAVLEAIADFPIESVLVAEAKGFGRQKDQLPRYVGSEYSGVYLPKIEISLLAPDEAVDGVLARIIEVARTGRIGDGKIFVFPVIAQIDV
jgi:nitrogen regulatory protein PII